MKSKLLIAVALCAMAFTANAQTEKGNNLIGGSIGYSSNKSGNDFAENNDLTNSDVKSKSFSVLPSFGHFFSKNFAIGLRLGYNDSETQNSYNYFTNNSSSIYNQKSDLKTFSVGPFVRHYVNITNEFKFFGQLNTLIGFGKGTYTRSQILYDLSNGSGIPVQTLNYEDKYNSTTYGASLNPGFAFFPTKRWAIEFSFPLLDYSKTKPKEDNLIFAETESFNFALDSFNPSIGFNFHF